MAPLSLYSYLTHVGSTQATSYVNGCGERESERERERERVSPQMQHVWYARRVSQCSWATTSRHFFSPGRLTMPRAPKLSCSLRARQNIHKAVNHQRVGNESLQNRASLHCDLYDLYFIIWTHTSLYMPACLYPSCYINQMSNTVPNVLTFHYKHAHLDAHRCIHAHCALHTNPATTGSSQTSACSFWWTVSSQRVHAPRSSRQSSIHVRSRHVTAEDVPEVVPYLHTAVSEGLTWVGYWFHYAQYN